MTRKTIIRGLGTFRAVFLLLGGVCLGFSHSVYVENNISGGVFAQLTYNILDIVGAIFLLLFFVIGLINSMGGFSRSAENRRNRIMPMKRKIKKRWLPKKPITYWDVISKYGGQKKTP